jgi:surfeit locus 1 family protein
MKIGSHIFAPRPLTTLITVVALAGLVYLGRWQLQRAADKQVLFDQFSRGADATRTIDAATPPVPRYQHVEAHGHYDGSRQILIDNMTNADGRAGYFVITPFLLSDGAWLLVNRGWVPLGVSRAVLPDVAVSAVERTVRGRADHLPAAGIEMGQPAKLSGPFPAVANFPSASEIARLLNESTWSRAAEAVLLDADQPDGYVRQWQAPGFPPMRHIAYAVQWFGLALALIVIYIVTNVRRAAPRAEANRNLNP